jgi:hypothetical protein
MYGLVTIARVGSRSPFAHIIRPRAAVLDSVTFMRPTAPLALAPIACEQCGGIERWNVKTLSDRDAHEVAADPVRATVKELRAYDAPDRRSTTGALAKWSGLRTSLKGC